MKRHGFIAVISMCAVGCADTEPCSVVQELDGSVTIDCPDGSSSTLAAPEDRFCSVRDDGIGNKTIACDDGTSVTVQNGSDGSSCSVVENEDGVRTITCEDGTSVTVQDGSSCSVVENGDGTRSVTCDDGSSTEIGNPACTTSNLCDGISVVTCSDGSVATWKSGIECSVATSHSDVTCGINQSGKAVCWGGLSPGFPVDDHNVYRKLVMGSLRGPGPNDGSFYCGLRMDGTIACATVTPYGEHREPVEFVAPAGVFSDIASDDGWNFYGLRPNGHIAYWNKYFPDTDTWLNDTLRPHGPFIQADVEYAIKNDGSIFDYGEILDNPPTLLGSDGVFVQLSGDTHDDRACGVMVDGTLACWGMNPSDEDRPPEGRFVAVSVGPAHACGIREDRTVACWGSNDHGESSPPEDVLFLQIDAGSYYTCGITVEGAATCWGREHNGRASPPEGVFSPAPPANQVQ